MKKRVVIGVLLAAVMLVVIYLGGAVMFVVALIGASTATDSFSMPSTALELPSMPSRLENEGSAMRNTLLLLSVVILMAVAGSALTAASNTLYPPMDNGSLDRPDRPFDYFSRPTTVLGVRHAPNGTEVTPEGSLYTGYAEVGFFAGPQLTPVNQRVKTLERGYLPVVNMQFSIDGVNYDMQYFAVTLNGGPDGVMVNMIRLTASNPGSAGAKARLGAGMRHGTGLPNRAQHHLTNEIEHLLHSFNPKWKYAIRQNAALRSGKVIYTFDTAVDEAYIKQGEPYDSSQKSMRVRHQPADWMCIATWKRSLAPGESFTVKLVMPFEPASPKMMEKFRALDYDMLLQDTIDSWDAWLADGTKISVPESKINNTYKANLIYMAIAMDKEGEEYVQKVNEFQYDHFWLRDASFMLNAFGVTGHPFESEQGTLYFLKWQVVSGNFESQLGQLDGFGQSLWAFGRHYELTRSKEYLETVWPAIWKAFEWLRAVRADEKNRLGEGALGYGMMPISNPGDNELVDGHVVGHDLWALHGLEYIRRMAPDLAAPDQIAALDKEIADYRHWLDYNFNEVVKRTGGFISPALEPGGQDWANLKLIWPTNVLHPFDQHVTETLSMARYKFREGLMTYWNGQKLHHYIGIDIPQSHLIRGEQTKALQDFYALVAHTSSTHGGFEWNITPWGDRDFGKNIAPHGCFAGKWLLFYRNMLVREDGGELHLGSALSPRWLHPGSRIIVENAPTKFGIVGFTIESHEGGAKIQIRPPMRSVPERIILHLPEGFNITNVTADGSESSRLGPSSVAFSADTAMVEVEWDLGDITLLSYRSEVEDYLHVYWKLHKPDGPKGALFDED